MITQLSHSQLDLDFKRNTGAKAVPQLKQLVAGFQPRRTEFEPGLGHVGFVVGRFSPSTSVFPANHSTDCSTLIIVYDLALVL
jgi:hypothetical protein